MSRGDLSSRIDWIEARLAKDPLGLHDLNPPAVLLDSALPEALVAFYRRHDGGLFFHEAIEIFRSREARRDPGGGWQVGEHAGEAIYVTDAGRVVRIDSDLEAMIVEGTSFDRWLAGVIEAEASLLDKDGEFREEVFDEDGELTAEALIVRERSHLKRDAEAAGPRFRLARALIEIGELHQARESFEEVASNYPTLAWAWFELARISEKLGDSSAACDEAEAAADADPGHALCGFFLAHAARLADLTQQAERSRALATRALELDPDLARAQRDGAKELFEAGEREAARELLALAAVLAPKDLQILDLQKRLGS